MLRNCFLIFFLVTTGLSCPPAGAASEQTGISGKWNISWQARLGKEQGTIEFQQKGTELTGVFHGHGDPCTASGTLKGGQVRFNLESHGKPPYVISFTGTLASDKMSGKFELRGMKDGYDQHGENVQRTDYLWTAIRVTDTQKNPVQRQKPSR